MEYSYSRLDTFHTCRRLFYYQYIKGIRSADNLYSFLGTIVHNITEELIQGEVDNATAVEDFLQGVNDVDLMGFEWVSENMRDKYRDCIRHFFETFDPSPYKGAEIEREFRFDLCDVTFHGFIDCIVETENEIIIEDFKSSSLYRGKDLQDHARQLYIYAESIREYAQSVGKPIVLRFNFLKYATNAKGKLVERNALTGDNFGVGYKEVAYDDSCHDSLVEWVSSTLKDISELDVEKSYKWSRRANFDNDFFCRELCSHYDRCMGRCYGK